MKTTAEQRAWWRQNAGAPLALLDDLDAALALLRETKEWYATDFVRSHQTSPIYQKIDAMLKAADAPAPTEERT